MKQFDAIVIGSGQGGTPLSKKLAKAGWKTALIEKRWIGGTCVNDGCTPTKTMVASARMAYLAGHCKKLGINIESFCVDLPAIIARKNEIVSRFRNGAYESLKKTDNHEIIFGDARFTGAKTISVTLNDGGEEELTADHIFINTGTFTTIPSIAGLDEIPYLTSTTILDLEVIPQHLLVIGGGYIGMEFAQMFRRFGSQVTMLEFSDKMLHKEDRDIADCICETFTADGIKINKTAEATHFEKAGENIKVAINIGGVNNELTCSHVLVAVGRTPQTKTLGLATAGIETNERGFIIVNDKLQTSAPGVYALGDVKGGPAFTHIAYNDHLVMLKNLLHNADISTKGRQVPFCMFTDPQLGRVGLTETQAREKGLNIKVATLSMEKVARAIETTETRGIMKAVVDADTKQILGVAIIGEQGGEIMTVMQMAMMGNITYPQIREFIFAHPLYAESLNNLFISLDE
jgi:pyruvate/2-oxoglutarate dehydrogenase complex dihydrolipoamide dehydrogenase (E3) component